MYIQFYQCLLKKEEILYAKRGAYPNTTLIGFKNGKELEIREQFENVCDRLDPQWKEEMPYEV